MSSILYSDEFKSAYNKVCDNKSCFECEFYTQKRECLLELIIREMEHERAE